MNAEIAWSNGRPMYRMPGGEHLTIGATAMITQYGGGDTFAPLTDQHIYFDNFVVSTQPITHRMATDQFKKRALPAENRQ